MLTKISLINRIYRFGANKDFLIYTNDLYDQFTICDLLGEILYKYKYSPKELNFPLHTYDDGFSWTNKKGPVAVTFHKGKYKELDFPLTAYLDDDSSLYGRKSKNGSATYTKTNIQGKMIWESKDLGFSITYPTLKFCFFRKGLNQLTSLNNNTGVILWTYTLPEKYSWTRYDDTFIKEKITKILGIFDNKVWLVISNNGIVGVDITSGKESVYIDHAPDVFDDDFSQDKESYTKSHGFGGFNNNTQLDIENGIIFTLNGSYYGEVDLNDNNHTHIAWDISSTLKKQPSASKDFPFSISNISSYQANTVYIYDNSDSHCFGAFDRKTKKILWSEVFDEKDEGWGAIFNIKVASDYLYIHAKVDKSLHIYRLD